MFWRKATLGGYTWIFEFVDDLRSDDGTELDGYMVPEQRTIRLSSDLRGDMERLYDVLCHECFHAVLWHEGREDEDESLVIDVGEGMAQLLRPFLKKPRFKGAMNGVGIETKDD